MGNCPRPSDFQYKSGLQPQNTTRLSAKGEASHAARQHFCSHCQSGILLGGRGGKPHCCQILRSSLSILTEFTVNDDAGANSLEWHDYGYRS